MYNYTNADDEQVRVYEEEEVLELLNQLYDKCAIIEKQAERIANLTEALQHGC